MSLLKVMKRNQSESISTSEGKISENRIFVVMGILIVVILALNWVAYQSVDVNIPPQEVPETVQLSAHTSELGASLTD